VSAHTAKVIGLKARETVTDASLKVLAARCGQTLEWVDLANCSSVKGTYMTDAREEASELDPLWRYSDMAVFIRSFMPRWAAGKPPTVGNDTGRFAKTNWTASGKAPQMRLHDVLKLPHHMIKMVQRRSAHYDRQIYGGGSTSG
jgi:hypothetical protein